MSDETSSQTATEVSGAAQDPRTLPWALNAGGPRGEADAVELAQRCGVVIPEDIAFHFRDDLVPEGAYAVYNTFVSSKKYAWSDFYANERINVRLRRSVLESDEAIVGRDRPRDVRAECAPGVLRAPGDDPRPRDHRHGKDRAAA